MDESNHRSERSGGSNTTNDEGRDGGHASPMSRRGFLKTSAIAGASGLALGGSGLAAGANVVDERCGSGASFSVGGGDGEVINNDWSTQGSPNVDMCIFKNGDGSYGWEWDRGSTEACPENCPDYPEVAIGSKPWSNPTSAQVLPEQVSNVDEFEVDLDIDNGAKGEEWNLALEWWFTRNRPPDSGPTHEIMLILEKAEGHTKGGSIEEGAVTDQYGNVIDYWEYVDQRLDWNFHIFKVAANEAPSTLDLKPIMEYVAQETEDDRFSQDLWITGVEIGNETWDGSHGRTTVHDFDVMVNGQTSTTGVDSEFTTEPTDTSPPSSPSNLEVTERGETTATIAWEGATDDGTGVDHYVVTVDGTQRGTPSADATTATVAGLDADASYDMSVTAVDGGGNESDPATGTISPVQSGGDVGEVDGAMPTDPDGDGNFEDLNGNGRLDSDDVVVLFKNKDESEITDYADAYDFNGNGRVDYDDVASLFDEL